MFSTFRSAIFRKDEKASKTDRIISSYRIVPQHRDHGIEHSDLEKLAFIHHRTSIFNLGDYLSSPRHYFKITPKMGSRPTVVVGGGVYGNYQRFARAITGIDLAARTRVGWGGGTKRKSQRQFWKGKDAKRCRGLRLLGDAGP